MKTLQVLIKTLTSIPLTASWNLSALNEFKGKQDLYKNQSAEKLKKLKEHAVIESSISSNRIEGVTVENSRVKAVVFGNSKLRDRNEEEVRGYQNALRWVHQENQKIKINEKTILKLHEYCKGEIWDAGKFKEKQVDITEKFVDGTEKIRFKPPNVKESKIFLKKSNELWQGELKEKTIPPLLLLAASNLDFLSIHPFRDGNGRVSRLLLLLQLYHLGYDIGKYMSIEKVIEDNKERYYETLKESSQNWHEGKNDIWPYANFIFYILKEAYKKMDIRLQELPNAKGSKTNLVIEYIESSIGQFSVADIKYHTPGVSIDLIRKVLKNLQKEQRVVSLGRGRNAKWQVVPKPLD